MDEVPALEKKHKKSKKHTHGNKDKERVPAEEADKQPVLTEAPPSKSELVEPAVAQPTMAPRKIREFRSKNLLVTADAKRAVEITFSEVNYSVDVKLGHNPCGGEKETRHILKDISGGFRPGTLTAIMGASGAGKTSLLNLIANRVKKTGNFRYSGTVLVNGKEMDPISFQRTCAYLMQDDVMFPHLTVREQIYYCAKLQLKGVSEEGVRERVEGLIIDLGLTACADTLIGKAGVVRGISGGERKRTAIACELVTDPKVIFCDEPTSGLDSETAIAIMALLSDIAHAGRTVVCTIHQPSSEIFTLFDNLLLLSKGRIVYLGPAMKAVPHFASIGHPCPIYANPADFLMKILHRASKDVDLKSADAEGDEARFTTDYLASKYQEKAAGLTLINSDKTVYPITLTKEEKERALPMWGWILLRRAFTNYRRDKRAAIGRLGLSLVIGLLMGLIFLRLKHDQVSIQSRAGFLFTSIMFAGFVTMNGVLLLFPEERPVFMREYAKGMYSTFSYFVAKNLAEAPFQQASFLISACIYYYMVNLNPGPGHFFIYLLFVELMIAVTCSVGLVIGAGARNEKEALAFGPMLLIPFALFGGLFLNSASIPKYFYWLAYISPFKYAFHGVMLNEMRGQHFHCKDDQFTQNGTLCPMTTGGDVLNRYDIQLTVWANAGILFGLILFFRLLAYFSLLFFAKRHKATA